MATVQIGPWSVFVELVELADCAVRARHLRPLLAPEERERASRYHDRALGDRFVVMRGVLRCLLGARLQLDPAAVPLQAGSHGKPGIPAAMNPRGLDFSVSRSGMAGLIAIVEGAALGADIECVTAREELDALVAQYFSPCERQEYASLPTSGRLVGFYQGWTRKEAVLKAMAVGLSYPLSDFDVSLAPGAPAVLRQLGGRSGADTGWLLHGIEPLPGYIAAIALQGLPRQPDTA